MPERRRYVTIAFDKAVADWIKPLVEGKILGYSSLTEFILQSSREKLEHYLSIGIHPWSHNKKPVKVESRTAHTALALIVGMFGLLGIYALLSSSAGIHGLLVNPLRSGMDFLAFYDQNWFFIDLLIYLTIFVSASYVTVGRMFGHRGIAIGIGLLLAVAMAGLEASVGFAIRDLGVLAAAFLTVILGASLYHAFRQLHFDVFGAASTTALLIYAGIWIMLPPVYVWLQSLFPGFGYVITIVFLIGIYHLATKVFKERPPIAQLATEPVSPALPELQAYYPELKQEKKIVGTYLASITKRAKKDAKTIAKELTYVYHVLSKFGDTPESRKAIAKKLKQLIPKEHDLDTLLKQIQDLIKKIESVDAKLFGIKKSAWKKLKKADKKKLEEELQEELEKINTEEQLNQFQKQVSEYREALLTQVNQAVECLNQGSVAGAKEALIQAIKDANQASELLDEMKSLEELIEQITKKELEALKSKE